MDMHSGFLCHMLVIGGTVQHGSHICQVYKCTLLIYLPIMPTDDTRNGCRQAKYLSTFALLMKLLLYQNQRKSDPRII